MGSISARTRSTKSSTPHNKRFERKTMDKLKMHSPDVTQENIAKIRDLFPKCVTEATTADGKVDLSIDFEELRQELEGSVVEGPQERYHLDWPGKRDALAVANAPIAKTLRPVLSESVDFESTQNLFVEGDNLEALKLLLETYLGKVKMIYIDPPYNTGNDFVYRDNFAESKKAFLERSNQTDENGSRLVANTEANGRFHSDWLNMMYPRLRLARNLLAGDGVIFISIDDNEVHNLRKICDEIFGENAFVGMFPWRSRTAKTDVPFGVSNDVEWIIAYAKPSFLAGRPGERKYFKSHDYKDRWRLQDLTKNTSREERPNSYFTMVNPQNGKEYPANEIRTWAVTKDTFSEYYKKGKIVFPGDYDFLKIKKPAFRVFEQEDKDKARKRYGSESPKMSVSTYLPEERVGRTEHGSKEIRSIFGSQVFSYPKPTTLIDFLLETIDEKEAIVLDFFCGSGTTAEAVLKRNALDGGKRRFIVVQLAEELVSSVSSQKTAYDFCKATGLRTNLAALAEERIRRAGRFILKGKCDSEWNRDTGFRVLKVDTSNMEEVYYTPDKTSQKSLLDSIDNIKPNRTPEDLLFQVLIDWGVDLTLPISSKMIEKKKVFFVDNNVLVACFDTDITEELVTELAKREPLRVVFRDNGFSSDSVKINVEQIFKHLSPITDVKVF